MKEKSTLARQDPVLYPEPRAIPGEVPQWAVMLRYFYRQRFRLLFYLLLFLGIGLVGFLLYPKTTEGLLTLTFPGIEKHEYPSGRQFSVEDFRHPQILLSALGDVGIPREKIDLRKIAGKVYVTPIIPDEVLNRWKKQARDGAIKESYYPYEFKIAIEMPGLSDEQCIRSFDALVKRYQEQVKYEQRTALSFLSGGRATSYHDLAQRYDYWDIPNIFEQIYSSMFRQLNTLISESVKARDSRLQLKFRDLERNLAIWYGSRLQSLTAVTITGGLVKDKDLMIKRIQFQLDDFAAEGLNECTSITATRALNSSAIKTAETVRWRSWYRMESGIDVGNSSLLRRKVRRSSTPADPSARLSRTVGPRDSSTLPSTATWRMPQAASCKPRPSRSAMRRPIASAARSA